MRIIYRKRMFNTLFQEREDYTEILEVQSTYLPTWLDLECLARHDYVGIFATPLIHLRFTKVHEKCYFFRQLIPYLNSKSFRINVITISGTRKFMHAHKCK